MQKQEVHSTISNHQPSNNYQSFQLKQTSTHSFII